MKEITIVTITYNSSEHISNLLNSLNNEASVIDRVIVIENNSPDKYRTRAVINSIKDKLKYKTLFVINKSNDGFAKSCNYGAKKTRTKYILFLNPDAVIYKHTISHLVAHSESRNADIVGCKITDLSGKRQNSFVRSPDLRIGLFEFSNLGKLFSTKIGTNHFYYINSPKIHDSKNDVFVDAVSGACLMVKKESFLKLNGFDERFFMYLEDVDLGIRANRVGMKVMYCPHAKIQHEGGASSKNKYRIRPQAWYDSRKKYYLKHFGLFYNLILQPIFYLDEYLTKVLRPM